MKFQIDNLDGLGLRDYTEAVDATRSFEIIRRLNHATELRLCLVLGSANLLVPPSGARILLHKQNGEELFAGYLVDNPAFEYLGWLECGPVYRYNLNARSDEVLLDRKRLPDRAAFVNRPAGAALRQLTEDLLPGAFDTSAVSDQDIISWYSPTPQKSWSEHAAELALRARASYRATSGSLTLSPLGSRSYSLSETDADFSPRALQLRSHDGLINDITVVGRTEPSSHVRAYFVGDGYSTRFYLSQLPFTRSSRTIFEEEYQGTALDATRWKLTDPAKVISVGGGQLQLRGGTGADGGTTVCYSEAIELGAAVVLQHGETAFTSPSQGVIGGLYAGDVTQAGCFAGFHVQPSGAGSVIQALINGMAVGPTISTAGGHHYAFTTRLFATEIYRQQQTFHSSRHPAGAGIGGAPIAADIRVVLEVHDIDPADPGSLIAPSTVLFDGVIADAPGFCTYALVNAANLKCTLTFTRFMQAMDAEVRSALPGLSYRTRLTGSLADGAECLVTQAPALQFFPQYVPAPNELIEVRYRGIARSLARVVDQGSISAKQRSGDDGIRGVVRNIQSPPPRSSVDCEHAALAILEDAKGKAWSGDYETWSDFLPSGAHDIFPGDALDVNVPSREAIFRGIVRDVQLQVKDLAADHSLYKIHFADDVAEPLALSFQTGYVSDIAQVATSDVSNLGNIFLPDLTAAEITSVSSTTVNIDAGSLPPADGGFEIRRTDYGWGEASDRNLVGRFASQSFTVPRLARVQDYYIRQYGGSSPVRYSRFSAVLHLDYPL
jgi:hypothetical protein